MGKNSVTVRTFNLDGNTVEYDVRKSNRAKYLQLRITADSRLEVVLPRGVSASDGEKFVISKSDWIRKYVSKLGDEQQEYLYLGDPLTIRHEYDMFTKKHLFSLRKRTLHIKSPQESAETTDMLYEVFLKHMAKRQLIERTMYIAQKYGFSPKRVVVRNQKTRWGSCSSNGTISLNLNVMKYRIDLIDYLIVHELCHMREMNHSKAFWSEVGKIIPNYKRLRKELRESGKK